MITRQTVAEKIKAYLQQRLTLTSLVDWAERAMMENDFEQGYFDEIRDVISRLGLADVRAFGLTWEDIQSFLDQLGYRVSVEVNA